jgi:two-component system, LytTR family, sensor kinase
VNASLLINALGHSAGVLIFGIFLVLLIQDRATRRLRGGFKSILAAALALAWNLASLIVLGLDDPNTPFAKITIAIGFGVLSLLPAVLFDLCLFGPNWDQRYRVLVRAGYALSIAATALHAAELFVATGPYHGWGLALITAGFGVLTVIAALRIWREQPPRSASALATDSPRTADAPRATSDGPTSGMEGPRGTSASAVGTNEFPRGSEENVPLTRPAGRLVGTMSLLLLAMSFVHLGGEHAQLVWSHELAFHHAAIPLALLILLQDYRFLLLDAFLRFLANVFLAALFVSAAAIAWRAGWLARADTPVHLALLLAGSTLALVAFALLRGVIQRWLTSVVFRRPDTEALLADLKIAVRNEEDYLTAAAARLAEFMGAEGNPSPLLASGELSAALGGLDLGRPVLVSELAASRADSERAELERRGAEAIVPLTVRPGVARYVLLGRRSGGRRYLSEDLQALARASAVVAEQLEQHRESEMRRLVAQAELRALQSQIHPHFLFNALNTLYGIIPKEAKGARDTVLNLADIFRYFLETKKTLLPLQDELHIVRAYLEIERLRLGAKLRVEIDVTPEALGVSIPILSIQPLVENAVKHGIAPVVGQGLVRIEAHIEDGSLHVSVSDSGPGFGEEQGTGVGLENVTRRLELSYGSAARLEVRPGGSGAEVRFSIPAAPRLVEVLR